DEPAADLAVSLSIVSSFRDRQVDPRAVVAGEIGLSGELRSVGQLEIRLREAAKLGFERAVVPRSTALRSMKGLGLDLVPAATLREAINAALLE
ncbi:MAG TPA: magnesium chelatase domain-containing protein, partial [Chloroflexota bacterium]|nr:magnesium chelatase domain-containing protein [Chloroflexota bacterium]